VHRHVARVERKARTWTDAHREEARRLQAEGLSWSQIAERVCGEARFKSTVGVWLRQTRQPAGLGTLGATSRTSR
jgi:hypothetical protein